MNSDMDTSGLPCQDQSIVGKQLFEDGPTIVVFIAHAKYHIERKTRILVIENVTETWLRSIAVYQMSGSLPYFISNL